MGAMVILGMEPPLFWFGNLVCDKIILQIVLSDKDLFAKGVVIGIVSGLFAFVANDPFASEPTL